MSSAILNKYIRPEVLSQLTRFKLTPPTRGRKPWGAHKSPSLSLVEFGVNEYVAGDDLRT